MNDLQLRYCIHDLNCPIYSPSPNIHSRYTAEERDSDVTGPESNPDPDPDSDSDDDDSDDDSDDSDDSAAAAASPIRFAISLISPES